MDSTSISRGSDPGVLLIVETIEIEMASIKKKINLNNLKLNIIYYLFIF